MLSEQTFRAFLKDAYKLSDTELDSLNNESDEAASLTALLEKDKDRVSSIRKPLEGKFEQGQQLGIKKAMGDLERTLREKYNLDSDLQGIDLVDAIVAAKAKAVDMPEDKVKLTPTYQQAEKTFKQQLQQVSSEWETKYNQRESQYQKDQKFQDIAKQVRKLRADKGYKIPEDAEVASNIEEALFAKLKAYDYQDQEGRTVISREGKLVEDGHARSEELESFLTKNLSSFYVMPKNNGGGNSGNGREQVNTNTNTNAQGIKYSNDQEYQGIMQDKSGKYTPEQKKATYEQWRSQQPVS